MTSKHAEYRMDIQGLRAVAVLLVIFFHLQIPGFDGGFVGVDVFFVISGFLITQNIWRDVASGNFVFGRFLATRIKRLFPALYATVIATFIASCWILTPDDFERFARSAVAALFAVSNILFNTQAGYWDADSTSKPLLHTWSLGVEEQFYLVWPFIVISIFRSRFKKNVRLLLILLSMFGFLLSATVAHIWPATAFYEFPFRVFQFSTGALASFVRFQWPEKVQSARLLGLAAIVAPAFVMPDGVPWPGVWSLLPTIGTFAVIVAGTPEKGIFRTVLVNPATLWVGMISYSLYLAHWPVIVLWRYAGVDMPGLLILVLLSGAVLYYAVERGISRHGTKNRPNRASPIRFAKAVILVGALAASVAGQAWATGGWVWRFPDIMLTPSQIKDGMSDRFAMLKTGCWIENAESCPGGTRILFFGNSHEPDAFNFYRAGLGSSDAALVFFGTINRCKNMRKTQTGWVSDSAECRERLRRLFSSDFLKNFDLLVYAANLPFSANKALFLKALRDIHAIRPDLPITVFGGYINLSAPCPRLINLYKTSHACRDPKYVTDLQSVPSTEPYYQEIMSLADSYIDRVGLLCANRELKNCKTEAPNGAPFTYDEHHNSRAFAEYAGRLFFRIGRGGPRKTSAPAH